MLDDFIEISDHVYVGNKYDYIRNKDKLKNIIFVCATNTKDINVNQENAFRGNTLFLNLVDANDIKYINDDAMFLFMNIYQENKDKTFILFCDKGFSRSPSLALLILLWEHDKRIIDNDFNKIIQKFKQIYPDYSPNKGILDYVAYLWEKTDA